MYLIRLHSTLCWLIPDWFRRKAHYFTQCLQLMSQGSVFNYILTLYKIQVMEDLGNKKMAHHMITSLHFCVVDIPCSPMMDSKGRIFIDRDGALFRFSTFKKEINQECQQCLLVRMMISLIRNAAIWSGTSLTTCAMRGSCCQIIFRLGPSITLLVFDIERSQKKIGILNSSLSI